MLILTLRMVIAGKKVMVFVVVFEDLGASLVAQKVKNLPTVRETQLGTIA